MNTIEIDMLRGMPRAEDAEQGLLSCLLSNPIALCDDMKKHVPPDHFYHAGNRLIFTEILAANEAGVPINLQSLCQWFIDRATIDKIGGPAILAELLNFNPTPAHYPYFIGILRDKALLRRTVLACTTGIQKCYEHQEDVPEAVAAICSEIFDAIRPDLSSGHKSFKTHISEYLDIWQKRMTGEVDSGIPTRWDCFNSTFGGITAAYWLLAAYPSEGKSSLAQNLMEDTVCHGKHAVWYSYEMDRTECLDRLMVARSGIDSDKVFRPRNNKPTQEDARSITRAITEMNEWGMHLRCEPSWTIEQIDADVKALCAKHPVGLVVIDFLQLVPTQKTFGSRAEQVAYISRLAKRQISAANRVAVLMLSQLNDDGKTLDSRAPNQDASNALSIEGDRGLLVVKNRNGRKGHFLPLRLNGATFSFEKFTPEAPKEKPASKPKRDWHKD
jgi:replicative DNA helicase